VIPPEELKNETGCSLAERIALPLQRADHRPADVLTVRYWGITD
jgi:hypothetical protein